MKSLHDPELLDRAAEWPECRIMDDLDEAVLRKLTEQRGIDFATAVLFDRISRAPQHRPWIELMEEDCEHFRFDYTLAVIPGLCYAEYPHLEADGRRLRKAAESLGCRTVLVPVTSFGTPAINAEYIYRWLQSWAGGPIVIVTLSKAASDFKVYLSNNSTDPNLEKIIAWLDLSGIHFGTPLIDELNRHRFHKFGIRCACWYQGYCFDHLRDLQYQTGPLRDDVTLPADFPAVHVVGFPTQATLSSGLARRNHRWLMSYGPNDGGGLVLADVLRLPGSILPIWGCDHFLRTEGGARPFVQRLLRVVMKQATAQMSRSTP